MIYENGKLRELTDEEKQKINNAIPAEIQETVEYRLEQLEKLFNKISKLLGIKEV